MSLSFLWNAWFVLLLIIDFDKRRISAAPLPGGAFLFVVDEIKQPFVGLIAGKDLVIGIVGSFLRMERKVLRYTRKEW